MTQRTWTARQTTSEQYGHIASKSVITGRIYRQKSNSTVCKSYLKLKLKAFADFRIAKNWECSSHFARSCSEFITSNHWFIDPSFQPSVELSISRPCTFHVYSTKEEEDRGYSAYVKSWHGKQRNFEKQYLRRVPSNRF